MSLPDKNIVLLITCMTAFITPFLGSSVNIALPAINADFSITDQALLGWVVTAFMLAAAIFVVPFGRIADIFGRRIVFLSGLSIVVISSVLCSVSTSVMMLIVARAIEGFGSAMIFGTSVAILTAAFPVKERGKALGINVAVTYAGLSLGPVLGGYITQNAGWRFIYAGIAVYALIVVLLAAWKITDEARSPETGTFDFAGTILYAAMLFMLIYGLSQVPDLTGIILIGLSLVTLLLFFWWELRNKNPILKISVFRRNPVFLFSNIAALINYSATMAVAFLLSLYLQYTQGFDPQTAGMILIAQPVIMAVFSPLTGRLSDRIEPRIVASVGMGLCVIGLTLFVFLTPQTSLLLVIGSLVFLGMGFALFSSPNTNAIMSSVEKRDYGMASGMVSTMRLIGQMLSLGITMLIFSLFIGHIDISTAPEGTLMNAIRTAFIIFAVLCIIGTALSLLRGNLRKEKLPVVMSANKN